MLFFSTKSPVTTGLLWTVPSLSNSKKGQLNNLYACYLLTDTANVYRNESDIGAAIASLTSSHQLSRSDIFITSKIGILSSAAVAFEL